MNTFREDILTIFTPVYNRAEYLGRLFDSLKIQTCKNFEWIALDDGSTDNSLEVLRNLRKGGGGFAIKIMHTENGGKHRGINLAVREAQGEFFAILDSDDYMLPDAVENILAWIRDIKNEPDYEYFAGVAGLKLEGEEIIGGSGTGASYIDATNLERRKYNLGGDKAEVYKTVILKNFPFPEFDGENFLSEGPVWNLIALAGYKLRWYPVALQVCEYLPGGLTDMVWENSIRCLDGYTYNLRLSIALNRTNIFNRMRRRGHYTFLASQKGLSKREAARKLCVNYYYLCFASFVWLVMRTIKHKLIKVFRSNQTGGKN